MLGMQNQVTCGMFEKTKDAPNLRPTHVCILLSYVDNIKRKWMYLKEREKGGKEGRKETTNAAEMRDGWPRSFRFVLCDMGSKARDEQAEAVGRHSCGSVQDVGLAAPRLSREPRLSPLATAGLSSPEFVLHRKSTFRSDVLQAPFCRKESQPKSWVVTLTMWNF